MGCESCSNGQSGLPRGCKNNGTCSTGGCNKLEVYDWLADMEIPIGQKPFNILEIRFKNSRKGFFLNVYDIALQVGDAVVVEGSPGFDIGVVTIKGELARIQYNKKESGGKPVEIKKYTEK